MPGGRPPKLVKETKDKLVELMRAGNYLSVACGVVGISVDAINYWRRLHEAGDRRAKQHEEFFIALKAAGHEAEVQALKAVQSGTLGWQGRAWFLERRHGDRWLKPKDKPAKKADQVVDVLADALLRAEELRKEREAEAVKGADADAGSDSPATG